MPLDGRDDLGVESGRRAVRRTPMSGRPLGQAAGGGVQRTRVVKRYGSRLPVPGADPELDAMLDASRQPWTCSCGRERKYHVKWCTVCGDRRPW